jgi:hypothetical protein|tara:strand:+ start:1041 stop:2837 length:1797 start_codon:yes stop_codon:yes gene_type:complete
MSKNKAPIKYTSRDFESIRRDLIDYAKRYYSETFKDFSDASFGSLMIDTVAYVGDILSFYLDYQVNESFLNSAIEYNNVVSLGEQMGYKFKGPTSAYGVCAFYVSIPANTAGLGPDLNYIPMLKKGATVSSTGGATFILLEDLDFRDSSNQVVVLEQNVDTAKPTSYGIQAFGRVVSGELGTETISVGSFERFKKVNLGTLDVVEILSVTDDEGNVYYEVPFLSQNVVYRGITNRGQSDGNSPAAIIKPFTVPRRFVTKRSARRTTLQFGYGSESETNEESVADPTNVVIQKMGRNYISDTSFDPSKLLDSDKFGISPSNTTLRVNYRRNTLANANAAAGTVNTIVSSRLQFESPDSLNSSSRNSVLNSLAVTNVNPISGQASNPSLDELRQQIMDNFSSQDRVVTEQDYKAFIYTMPGQFGSVKRCAIYRDSDSFRRNLNLYVISSDKSGHLRTCNLQVKENVKTWLGQSKMINDTIDILDAKVVNVQIKYTLLSYSMINSLELIVKANEALKERYSTNFDIGENFDLDEVRKILSRIPGVDGVRNVRLVNKFGGRYSDISYSVSENTDAQNRFVEVPRNVILEIKYPDADIIGSLK